MKREPGRFDLAVFSVAAAAAVWGADLAVSAWLGPAESSAGATQKNVQIFSADPLNVPPPTKAPSLLLMGNSHTYGLPSLTRGGPLRSESTKTLIFRLSEHVDAPDAVFQRLSYPNFLPLEMLSCYVNLGNRGYRPSVVVLGITWQNLARGRSVRPGIRKLYGDAAFTESVVRRLGASGEDRSGEIAAWVREIGREESAAQDRARSQPAADRLETEVLSRVSRRLDLVGRSEAVRAKLYRSTVLKIQDLYVKQATAGGGVLYDVIDDDLRFNLDCLSCLLALIDSGGCRCLIYYPPQRSDLPPAIAEERRETVLRRLNRAFEKHGFSVADARGVVPNDQWGWVDDLPDGAHFLEPGHELLAEFLTRQGESAGVWRPLKHSGGAPP